MPKEFYERARTVKVFAIINFCSVILSVVSVCMLLEMLFVFGISLLTIPFFLLLFASVLSMILTEGRSRVLSEDKEPYCVSIFPDSTKSILTALCANEIKEDVFVSLTNINGYSTRILVQEIKFFDNVALSKERKKTNQFLNRFFNTQQMVPLYSALKMIRINIIVCHRANEALYRYLSKSTENLFFRNEIIIPVVVVLEQRSALFPKISPNVNLNQLSRYLAAVTYIHAKFRGQA